MNTLKVKFNGTPVRYKQPMDLRLVGREPVIDYPQPANKYYTTIMFDPDAPSYEDPVNKNWLHWLRINNKLSIVPFQPSDPPKGSGPHRYCICLLEQQKPIEVPEFEQYQRRAKFNVEQFVNRYRLKPVGYTMYVAERH